MDATTVAVGAWLQLGRAEGGCVSAAAIAKQARAVLANFEPQVLEQLSKLADEQAWALAITLEPWRRALDELGKFGELLAERDEKRAEQLRLPARAAFHTLRTGMLARAGGALRGAVAGWRGLGQHR